MSVGTTNHNVRVDVPSTTYTVRVYPGSSGIGVAVGTEMIGGVCTSLDAVGAASTDGDATDDGTVSEGVTVDTELSASE